MVLKQQPQEKQITYKKNKKGYKSTTFTAKEEY